MAKEMKTVSVSDLRIRRTKGSVPTVEPENLKDVQVVVDKLSAKVDGLDDEMTEFDKRLTALEPAVSVTSDAAPEPDAKDKKGK